MSCDSHAIGHSLPCQSNHVVTDTNRTRLIRKAHPIESFFNFFTPPVPPAEDALENGDVDEDELEDLEERLELDYQIGEDMKERVCPLMRYLIQYLQLPVSHIPDHSTCHRLLHWKSVGIR